MTLRKFWLILSRWKWIVIGSLILSLGGGAAAGMTTPVTYQVEASHLFLSPVLTSGGAPGNPFLQLGNGVAMTVDILAVSLSDGVTEEQFVDEGSELTYTAARNASLSAPIMVIAVEDTNLAAAYTTLDALGAELDLRLDKLQQDAGAPTGQWITASELTRDPKPVLSFATPLRNGVSVTAAVLLLGLLCIVIAERRRGPVHASKDRNLQKSPLTQAKAGSSRPIPDEQAAPVLARADSRP